MLFIKFFQEIEWNFKMKFSLLLFSFFLFTFCTYDVDLKPVDQSRLLNDGNSKFWIVDCLYKGRINHADPNLKNKDLIVFFVSGNCIIQKVNKFAQNRGDIYSYALILDEFGNRKIVLKRKNKKWEFRLNIISSEKIRLTPLSKKNFEYDMVLIPFPEN